MHTVLAASTPQHKTPTVVTDQPVDTVTAQKIIGVECRPKTSEVVLKKQEFEDKLWNSPNGYQENKTRIISLLFAFLHHLHAIIFLELHAAITSKHSFPRKQLHPVGY